MINKRGGIASAPHESLNIKIYEKWDREYFLIKLQLKGRSTLYSLYCVHPNRHHVFFKFHYDNNHRV